MFGSNERVQGSSFPLGPLHEAPAGFSADVIDEARAAGSSKLKAQILRLGPFAVLPGKGFCSNHFSVYEVNRSGRPS